MRKFQLILVAVLLVVAGFFAAVKKVHKELPVFNTVPAFELTDQTGKPFSSSELQNKIWIAAFVFTRCKGPCPIISSKMSALKKRLSYSSRLAFVSFSVDPDYDNPAKLAEYAAKFDIAGKPAWHFLTGPKDKIYELAIKTFMQSASDDKTKKDLQARFMHGTRIALVDDQGHIRGLYDSSEEDIVRKLELDTRAIL